jgi:hypothetical protein
VPLNLTIVFSRGDSAALDFLSMTILISASLAGMCFWVHLTVCWCLILFTREMSTAMPAYAVGSKKSKQMQIHYYHVEPWIKKPTHVHFMQSQLFMISLLRDELKTSWTTWMKSLVNVLLCARTVNLPLFIMVCVFFTVHCVIQTVLHYWAPRQLGPIYPSPGSQSQPMTNGFVTKPSSPLRPVTHLPPNKGIMERLQLFMANSCRSLKCKLDPKEHDQWMLIIEHFT